MALQSSGSDVRTLVFAVNTRVPFREEILTQTIDDERFLGAFATSSFRDAELIEQINFPFQLMSSAFRG